MKIGDSLTFGQCWRCARNAGLGPFVAFVLACGLWLRDTKWEA